jgi:hypothetical protein
MSSGFTIDVGLHPRTEIDDAELEALWERYLDGIDLPAHFTAYMTIRGPEISICRRPETHRWLRSREPHRGRFWRKTLIIG